VEFPHFLRHDVIHASGLVDGNRTSDAEIARIADALGRVVVTEYHDFLDGPGRSVPRRGSSRVEAWFRSLIREWIPLVS